MFYHAYNGYLEHAYPRDELRPLSCTGQDTWGSYSLTLVDSLDTLLIMGNSTEFAQASKLVLNNLNLDRNLNISVFETNIRIIGGLLSAHMLSSHSPEMPLPAGWPCSGPFLDLAERFAQRLLPAFRTKTGMPLGTVNLKYGVNNFETSITCTAGVGTFLMEFGALSRLTGNPHYERVALRALDSLWASRSKLGLVGNHIDVQTGIYTATDSGIGAGVDSYFEYLVKSALLFQRPALMEHFNEYEKAINKHVRKDDWFVWVDKDKASVSLPIFQSLEAFWPGLLTLIGKVEDAARIMASYLQMLQHLGLPPEFYNIPNREPVQHRQGYPLRPEIAESLMYLFAATEDPIYLQAAAGIVDTIDQLTRTNCGFASVRDVRTWTLEDRMESFFLSETTKYLYLIFDKHNFIHNDGTTSKVVETTNGPCMLEAGGWIFNTEAHPLDAGIVHCCSKKRQNDLEILRKFEENIDLLTLLPGFEQEQQFFSERNDGEPFMQEEQQKTEKYEETESTFESAQQTVGFCLRVDDPALGAGSYSFWHEIYLNYLDYDEYIDGEFCLEGEEEEKKREREFGSGDDGDEWWNYSQKIPDLSSLPSDAQILDAVQQISLDKFKYVRPAPENAENDFSPLFDNNPLPFDRHFLGVGQIV